MESIIGIDVGGTSIKWGRVDSEGNKTVSGKVPTEREKPREVLTKIVDIVSAQEGVTKIGLSFPGIVGPDGSLLTSGAIIGLEGTPLRKEIEQLTGLPTVVVNDAHAAGQAERWLGDGADCDTFVCMTLGTGIGGAVFINGQLYRGFRGAAGELSMSLLGTGSTREELEGAIAARKGGAVAGLARLYSAELGIVEPTEWFTDTWEILRLAEAGDEKATRATDAFYQGLTAVMINVMTMYDPERILLGGGLSDRPGFLDETRKRLTATIRVHPAVDPTYVPELRLCRNGNDAGILGAIYAAHTMK
ncbi:MAG: ROK family protein [Ancrocorticia sp.]